MTVLALLNVVLTLTLPVTPPATPRPRRTGIRLLSRHAIPLGAALVLTTVGHSSLHALVPLYAIGHGQGPTLASLLVAAALLGSGGAVPYTTLAALVLDRAPEADRGLALGTLSASWELGVVVGSPLVGAVAGHVSYWAGFLVGGSPGALERWSARSREAR